VSIANNKALEVTSWILQNDRSKFKQEKIIII